jgi:hypothetical protein
VAAHFRDSTATYQARVGQKASLECDPEGDQPIIVHWSKNGSRIHPKKHANLKVKIFARKRRKKQGENNCR